MATCAISIWKIPLRAVLLSNPILRETGWMLVVTCMKKKRSILWWLNGWKFVHRKSQRTKIEWHSTYILPNPICMLNQFFSIEHLNLHFANFQEAQLFIRPLDNHISYANDVAVFPLLSIQIWRTELFFLFYDPNNISIADFCHAMWFCITLSLHVCV